MSDKPAPKEVKEEREEQEDEKDEKQTGPPKWIPIVRDYDLEIENRKVKFVPTGDHPLMKKKKEAKAGAPLEEKSAVPEPVTIVKKTNFVDPLTGASSSSSSSSVSSDDPLSMLAKSPSSIAAVSASPPPAVARKETKTVSDAEPDAKDTKVVFDSRRDEAQAVDFEPWKDKVEKILNTYTTNKRVPVRANFLDDDAKEGGAGGEGEEEGGRKEAAKQQDLAKSRLESLEDPTSEKAKLMMSQKEYIAHIEAQHERMKNAWDGSDRVLALKIAIQCAKLLNDTAVPALYPSMYVLLTSVLDTFGDLVFERLKRRGGIVLQKGKNVASSLLHNFVASDVSATAKETAKNWFYKIVCIRELLPRLYVEMALIKSYRFLGEEPFPDILMRLAKSIRGIGNPLTAVWARAYLTTKCCDLWQSFKEPKAPKIGKSWYMPESYSKCLLTAFDDFLYTYKHFQTEKFSSILVVKEQKIELDNYIDLFSPAVQWLLQNIGYNSREDMFFALLKEYKDKCNNSMVLYHLLSSFDSSFISKHALSMTTLIKEADSNELTPKSKLYLSLGRALIKHAPPKEQRLPILNDIWKVVTKIQDPFRYMEIAVVFIEYLIVNFTSRELNIFLQDVLTHVKKDQAYKTTQTELKTIVKISVEKSKEVLKTISMDNFLPVFDLLDKEAKAEAGRIVLDEFLKVNVNISDPVLIHTLFDIAKSLHDALDSLSPEDDRRQIANVIIEFIRKIDFDRDLEKQLNTYVDCRQAFSNLDPVIRELVVRVALLSMKAHSFMKGKHNKKTSAFVKACLAYCHITIPSLDDQFARLYLLLQCGEVALVNQMITQGEGFLKAAISLIPEVPATTTDQNKKTTSNEEALASYILDFASFLLLFPGHPTHGPFYLVKGLLNALSAYAPWKKPSVHKCRAYLGILQLFCTYFQKNFPYHIERVDSNDSLYGGDPKYERALYNLVDVLITGILQQLDAIGKVGDLVAKKDQGELALDFVNVLISHIQMNPQSATLVFKLYQLAKKTGAVDKKYLDNTLKHIQSKEGNWYQDISQKIVNS